MLNHSYIDLLSHCTKILCVEVVPTCWYTRDAHNEITNSETSVSLGDSQEDSSSCEYDYVELYEANSAFKVWSSEGN